MAPADVAAAMRQVRPIEYNDTRMPADAPKRPGMLAHELQACFPLVVKGEKDATHTVTQLVGDTVPYLPGQEPAGYVAPVEQQVVVPTLQGVNYIGMIPYLIAAWQASDAELQQAKADLAALVQRVSVLEAVKPVSNPST